MLQRGFNINERIMSSRGKWTCKFCHKPFVLELRFEAHKCKQMIRQEEAKTPDGQMAYYYYQLWLRATKKNPPPISSFISSRYFRTFMEFARFVKSVNLPKPETFIKLMTSKDFTPTMWRSNDVYVIYLEFVDNKLPPMKHVELSVKTILDYCEKNEIETSQYFETINPNEVIQLIQARQLSPWLLLLSNSFKKMFAERTSPEQKVILETLIRPETWGEKIAERAEDVNRIKVLIKELSV